MGKPILRKISRRIAEAAVSVIIKRKFDGETYTMESYGMSKPEATTEAAKRREKGFKVRVAKTKAFKWAVYIRKK